MPTYDSASIFSFLVHTGDGKRGSRALTGFSDADLDAKIVGLSPETDLDVRNAMIADIRAVERDTQLYLPLHHQTFNRGMKEPVGTELSPEDDPKFRDFSMN